MCCVYETDANEDANAAADSLAITAAELVQLSNVDLGAIRARSELSKLVLRRLVAIAIKLAPASSAGARVIKVAGRQEDKAKLVDLWAGRSGILWTITSSVVNVSLGLTCLGT